MVLNCQLEVGQRDGDECCDQDQDDEDDEQDAPHGVHLVPPDGGKDVVQFDVYGREGKKPCSRNGMRCVASNRDMGAGAVR